METLLANIQAGKTRRATFQGREWIVAPASLIVPGVLNGSKGALFYPPEEVARNHQSWDGMPIVVYHPTVDGQPVSARAPGVWESQGIGMVRGASYRSSGNSVDKLAAEAWFDVENTRRVDPRILTALDSGQAIELSTGLYTDNDPAPPGSHHNGKTYDWIARNYRPDHLAVLPDQVGACSVKDGCGIMVNRDGGHPPRLDWFTADLLTNGGKEFSMGKKAWDTMGKQATRNANPEGINQYTAGMATKDANKATSKANLSGQKTDHMEAAEAHDNAADMYHEAGNDYKAQAHREARDEHYGAAGTAVRGEVQRTAKVRTDFIRRPKPRDPTSNAGTNQPRHLEDGTYLPHGAGTGKGEVHRAARTGRGEEDTDENEDAEGEQTMSIATVNKEFTSDEERKDAFSAMADEGGSKGAVAASGNAKEKSTAKAHREAASAHRSAAEYHGENGNTELANMHTKAARGHDLSAKKLTANRRGGTTMTTKPLPSRERSLELLTANCKCEEDKTVLNSLSNETLLAMTTNASKADDQLDDGDDENDDDDVAVTERGTQEAEAGYRSEGGRPGGKGKQTMNTWLQSMPQEARAVWNNAVEIERRERVALVRRLVVNVADGGRRKTLADRLMTKPLAELRDLIALLPPPVDNRGGFSETVGIPEPSYLGAAAPEMAANRDDGKDAEDILPLPTINWKEWAEEDRKSQA